MNPCPNCGEDMTGDGYRTPIRCGNADTDGYWYCEPDAGPFYCKNQEERNVNDGNLNQETTLEPEPDVAGLVEALERAVNRLEGAGLFYSEAAIRGRAILAAHRGQGDGRGSHDNR